MQVDCVSRHIKLCLSPAIGPARHNTVSAELQGRSDRIRNRRKPQLEPASELSKDLFLQKRIPHSASYQALSRLEWHACKILAIHVSNDKAC